MEKEKTFSLLGPRELGEKPMMPLPRVGFDLAPPK